MRGLAIILATASAAACLAQSGKPVLTAFPLIVGRKPDRIIGGKGELIYFYNFQRPMKDLAATIQKQIPQQWTRSERVKWPQWERMYPGPPHIAPTSSIVHLEPGKMKFDLKVARHSRNAWTCLVVDENILGR